MAVSSIVGSHSTTQVAPVARSFAPTPRGNSAASTIVVGKVTVTNPDGSTTTIITYADGHTETETVPATQVRQSAPSSAPPSGGRATGATGQLVDLLA